MDNMLEIAALNEEARRRGMNYGALVGITSDAERERIIHKFERAREARARREKAERIKKAPAE